MSDPNASDRAQMMWGKRMGQRNRNWFRLVKSTIVTGFAHVRRGWWRRLPFLPLPDRTHLAWRRWTAYGSDRPAERQDIETFLLWADRQRRAGA